MSEKETIHGIAEEMRNLGKLDEKSTDRIPRSLMALGLLTYADRIEAADNRECCRTGQMRKALERIVSLTNSLDENCAVDPIEIRDIARKALKGRETDVR